MRRLNKNEQPNELIIDALRELHGQDFIDIFGAKRSCPQFRLKNYGELD